MKLLLLGSVMSAVVASENTEIYSIHANFDEGSTRSSAGQSDVVAEVSTLDRGSDAWFDMPSFQFQVTHSARSVRTDTTFFKDDARRSESGRVIWHGSNLDSVASSAMLLRDNDGAVAGIVSLDDNRYEITQIHDGSVLVALVPTESILPSTEKDVETSRFSASTFLQNVMGTSDGEVGEIPSSFLETNIVRSNHLDLITCGNPIGPVEAVVDVLVVVTNEEMCNRAFQDSPCDLDTYRGSMDRRLALAETQVNLAYQTVGVPVVTNFIDTVYIAPGFKTPATSTTLNFVKYSEDIEHRRNQVGADLVAFIGARDPKGVICGIAYLEGEHSVTASFRFCPTTLIHELGHNFGCMHHPSDTFFDTIRYGKWLYLNFFGYGYEDPSTIHTIMAYGCEGNFCPEIPYFSSDECTYDGNPMGDRWHNNARMIRKMAPKMSNYRARTDATDLPAEITLFDTPAEGLKCHPHKAGVCGYGQSLLHFSFVGLICFNKCIDDDQIIDDISFGIDWLSWLNATILPWLMNKSCGPCDALLNF